ncbi:hypothetical protein K2173_015995 [Erythroxylum novogranatense]|uniref:CONSTANS-like protein n=1 Tax=Erythroxylum novogranatense TaxID=1862640 RepID=A0AAV8SFM3_9ROSI|nr:hypothetical protein K2173_015995 [Erythroxylum novogranatense]
MGIEVESLKNLTGRGWSSMIAKRCDSCKITPATAFCRADSAFLCMNCDSKIHGVNQLMSRHERVWMCEVCEQAPAAVTCRADAAALCVTCDADIHSANPLARRHERVPIEPFFDSSGSIVRSSPFNFLVPGESNGGSGYDQNDGVAEGAVSWLLPSPPELNSKRAVENITSDHFFTDMDPFLDFEYQNLMEDGKIFQKNNHNHGHGANDSVVPVQTKQAAHINPVINTENCFDIDFCRSKLTSFNYPTQSVSQSVSSSSHDVGVVPDGSSMSDTSFPFNRNSDSSINLSTTTGSNQATQLCGLDREARVLRYRQRRKNRKFEKTIRYASRKAYAETRPRIKGRFAKRTEIESDIDQLYHSSSVTYMSESQYGVVPSF